MSITLADFPNVSNLLEFIKDAEVQHPTEECPICFEEYPTDPKHILEVNEVHVKLPRCGHEFFIGCLFSVIDKYGGNNFRCPMCRVVMVGDEGVARVLESKRNSGRNEDYDAYEIMDAVNYWYETHGELTDEYPAGVLVADEDGEEESEEEDGEDDSGDEDGEDESDDEDGEEELSEYED